MVKYLVNCVESERGFGQIYYDITCDSLVEAVERAAEINKHNTEKVVPDYYIVARGIEMVDDGKSTFLDLNGYPLKD